MKKFAIFVVLVLIVLVVYVVSKNKEMSSSVDNGANTASVQEKPIIKEFSSDNIEDQQEIYVEGLRKHSPPPPEAMR